MMTLTNHKTISQFLLSSELLSFVELSEVAMKMATCARWPLKGGHTGRKNRVYSPLEPPANADARFSRLICFQKTQLASQSRKVWKSDEKLVNTVVNTFYFVGDHFLETQFSVVFFCLWPDDPWLKKGEGPLGCPFVSLWKVQKLSQFHQIVFTNCEPKESLKMICELPPELDEGQMFAG